MLNFTLQALLAWRACHKGISPRIGFFLVVLITLDGCSSPPIQPHTTATMPLVMLPASTAGIKDERAEFRQLYCDINRQVGKQLPDYRPCDAALINTGTNAAISSPAIVRTRSDWDVDIVMVPGLGWECIKNYVKNRSMFEHIAALGYELTVAQTEGLSSSGRNADLLHAHLVEHGLLDNGKKIVLIGYSKGLPDIFEALVRYPRLAGQITAVVGIAGAVGGSPLANITTRETLDLFHMVPGSECSNNDGGALESLKPSIRQQWLAEHPLPATIHYYSLATYPEPDNISFALASSYKQLSAIDPRNDSQLIFYDQIIPGSTLLAYLNADHLAMAVPIARDHAIVAGLSLDRNAFPREVLFEAIMRYVEADITNAVHKR